MKGMKKLLSILMVLTLVLSLGATAFALDITVEEKVKETTGAEYTAWKLLNLTVTEEVKADGSGFSYTVNDDFRTLLQEVTGQTEDKDILDYMSKLGTEGHMTVDAFTKAAYDKIAADATLMSKGTKSVDNKFSGVEQGYYLIVETTIGKVGDQDGVASKLMLDTAGRENLTVTTKEDKPSIDKKVKDINDTESALESGWQMSGDWDIGDKVPFQITATVEGGDNFARYETYETVIHDKQSEGLTLLPNTMTITIGGKTYTYKDNGFYDGASLVEGITLITDPKCDDENCSFEISIPDVKKFGVGAGDAIVVEYRSELNKDAKLGLTGNPNEVKLEFTNDYINKGTGETPYVGVVVFTFKADVNKVNKDGALVGADFALLKKYASQPEGAAAAADYSYEAVQKAEKGAWFKETIDGKVVYWQVLETVKATSGSEFAFNGIDDGDYRLVETVVPDGYNKADDINFTVTVNHKSGERTAETAIAIGDLVVTSPMQVANEIEGHVTGSFYGEVMNDSGMELPETGGIGTTIFYIAGAILVAGAVILLVTKKRVSGMEK